MIQFDKNGYIVPYEIIEVSLADFEKFFVSGLVEEKRRKEIFEVYLRYLSELFETVGKEFFQLVDGSFTTTKELPRDIDLTTFVDYRIYKQNFGAIQKLSEKWNRERMIDSYLVPISYPGHPHFAETQLTFEYWKSLFSFSRRESPNQSKGLIKINFHQWMIQL